MVLWPIRARLLFELFYNVFYNIFRGNPNKNLHYPRIKISLSMYNRTAAKKP